MSDLPSKEELLRRARYAGRQGEYSRSSMEIDPVEKLQTKIGAKTLSALTSVYTGLQSFSGKNGGLFGEIGRAAMEPLQAIMELVQESRRRYQAAGHHPAVEALLGYATTGHLADLDENGDSTLERAKMNAARSRQASRQANDMAAFMAEQKLRGAVSDMARDLSATRNVSRSEAHEARTGDKPDPDHYKYDWAENPKLAALQRVEAQVDRANRTKRQASQNKNAAMKARARKLVNDVLAGNDPVQRVPKRDKHGNIKRDNLTGKPIYHKPRPLFDLKGKLPKDEANKMGKTLEYFLKKHIADKTDRDISDVTYKEVNETAKHALGKHGLGRTVPDGFSGKTNVDKLFLHMLRDPASTIRAINSTVPKGENFRRDLVDLASFQSTRLQDLLAGTASNFPDPAKSPLSGKDPDALFKGILQDAWEIYTARESVEKGTRLRALGGMAPAQTVDGTSTPRFKQNTEAMSLDDLKTFLALDSSYQRIVEDKLRELEGTGFFPKQGSSIQAAQELTDAISSSGGGPFFTRTVSADEFEKLKQRQDTKPNYPYKDQFDGKLKKEDVKGVQVKQAPQQDRRRAAAVLANGSKQTAPSSGRSVGALYVNEATGEVLRSNVDADSELYSLYMQDGVPQEATGDRETKANVNHAADVTQSETFANTNFSAIATGVMGDEATDLFSSKPGSVFDQLRTRAEDQINYYLKQLEKETGQVYKFEFETVSVDERHDSLVATIYEGPNADPENKLDSLEVGIVSDGDGPATYRTTGQDRAYTNPLMQIDSVGLYAHDEARKIVASKRSSNVIRGEERALIGMANYAEKFVNDLRGGRGEFSMALFKRIVEGSFEGSKLASKSPMDTARSALQIETAVEKRIDELRNNPTRRQQVEQGLESLDNYRRLFSAGGRFFTSDSEFVSPENIGEAGVSSSAKAPFDIAGSVVDAKRQTTVATIEYNMDLEGAREELKKRHDPAESGPFADTQMAKNQDQLEEEIRRIYTELSHFSEDEADDMMDIMRGGGKLQITTGDGETFNLISNDPDEINRAKKRFSWVREQRSNETLAQYYMNMQNKMLEELDVTHSVGQNYHQAEEVVYQNMSRMTGVQLHSALKGNNVIDMMNIAHALEPNTGLSSKSLDNVAAAVFELESSSYQQVMNLVGDELKDAKSNDRDVDLNKRVTDLEQQRKKQGKKRMFGDKQRDMLAFMDDALQEIHSDLGKRHTALFDAFMTGRIALMAVGERLAKKTDANLNVAERQARELLHFVDEFAGDRNAAERFGGIRYGGFNSDGDYDEEPSPFLQGQDDATLGRAVMVHARAVPLARLQNPIRQLYQRIKPKQLLGQRTAIGGVLDTENNGQVLRRARLSGGGTLTMQERRRQHHARMMGEGIYAEDPETSTGQQFDPVSQDEQDLLQTSRNAPMMFAGAGIDTKQQREFHGSAEQELQFSVTSRVAFLPNDHRRIWESQGVSTKARLDALKAMPDVRTQKSAVDLTKLRPEPGPNSNFSHRFYESAEMRDWVASEAQQLGLGDFKDENKLVGKQTELELLKETYYLHKIREDADSGITERGKAQIDAAIDLRRRRAIGMGISDKDLVALRMQQADEGTRIHNTGNASALFNPNFQNQGSGGGPMVLEGLNATKHANLLGLDLEVDIDENTGTAALKFHFIEDPTDTSKEMTMGSKVGIFGSDAVPVLGMAGETGIMEASFTKKKRRDFANLVQAQIGRLYNSAIEDLQQMSASDDAFSLEDRKKVVDHLASQLAELSGMDANVIRRTVLDQGDTLFADYFEMTYTKEFSQALEQNFTTTKMMTAAKDAGLSMRDVFLQGSQMLRRAEGVDASDKKNIEVQKQVRDKMIEQLDQEIENVQNFNNPGNKQGFSRMFGPNGLTGQRRKRALENLVKKMRGQRQLLEDLFSGSGNGIDNSKLDALGEEGSFWDLFVDDQGHLSASFRALAPSKAIQLSKIGGSMFGESFEKRVGRATKRKQSSLLTATLVSHSGSQTIGGATQEEQVFADVMRGWTAAKSGMAAFRDKRFRRMVAESLVNSNVSNQFFQESNVKEKDGQLMYEKNGRTVPLEQHISENFTWENGELYFIGNAGTKTKLSVDAFTTLRSLERSKAGVVGMVTGSLPDTSVGGTPVGGDGRTLRVVFGKDESLLQEDEISAREFYELFGKETRAQQHAQFVRGMDPADVDNLPDREVRSHPEYAVYHDAQYTDEKGKKYRQTVLNSQYDFLEIDMFGGIDGLDEKTMGEYVEALRKAGITEKELSRLLLTPETAKEALKQTLPDDEYAARAEVDRSVEHITDTQGTSTPKIYVETRTGAARPQQTQVGDDIVKTNVREWAQVADKLGGDHGGRAFHGMREAIERIHNIAQEQDLDTEAGRQELRRAFKDIFRSTTQDANLTEARDFYAASLRKAATGLVSKMQEAHGRYFGGRYKLSATQMDLQDTFLRLAKAREQGTDAFDEAIDKVVRDRYLQMADADVSQFNAIREQAKEELGKYIDTQRSRHGAADVRDIANWQGFGVGEGFIGRDAAERALEEMKNDLLTNQSAHFDDASDSANRARQRLNKLLEEGDLNVESLQEMTHQEVAILQQEIKNPGSTSGMIAMTIRQPDFTAAGEYEMARLSVFSDQTLRALGKNPSQMHLTSNPLIAWSRKGDFDYDLDFMSVMDSSLVAGMARQTRAQTMPIHMVNLHRAMDGAKVAGATRNASGEQALGAGTENGVGNIDIRQEEFKVDVPKYRPDGTIETDANGDIVMEQKTIQQTRVTTPMRDTSESTFRNSLSAFFADAGMAIDAVMQGAEARSAYALQQSIVGTFGAYAKQGAIKTRQRNSAFNSLMERLVDVTGEDGDFSERQMNELFDAIPGADIGVKEEGAFTQMLDTYNRFNRARSQTNQLYGKASTGDILHMAALTELEITQAVAIEKYKKGDAQRVSRRVNDVMQSLHGNYSGGISSFDEAWDAFMNDPMIRENLPFDPDQFFRGFGGDLSSEELAKEAFRLQHDMNQAVRMAAKAGVGDNYMSQHANVAIGEIPPGQQVAAATNETRQGTMASGGLSQVADQVNEALKGIDGVGTREIRQFFALQKSRNSRLEAIANMSDNTLVERMKNTLRDLPIGAKGMGLAAVAATGVSMMAGGGPNTQASSERYDMPTKEPRSYALGNRHTVRNRTQIFERRMQRVRYARAAPVRTGTRQQAGRPPTTRAVY